jgi:hypothetical protein
MKLMITLAVCGCLLLAALTPSVAQQTAGEYFENLNVRSGELSDKYLSYIAAVAHSRRAKKMEKRRMELIEEIKKNLADVGRMKPYKDDPSLRDAYKKYWDLLLKVFTKDYEKIVNMEEIAEQSYDDMEAYMMARKQASKILESAQKEVSITNKDFAARNNIRLIESDGKRKEILEKTDIVMTYYDDIYLIYFKSYKQESFLLKAVNSNDVNAAEQNRLTLVKFAKEGLAKLDTMKSFQGDASLVQSCRKMLTFYKQEAEGNMVKQLDYFVKRAEFDKARKAMDAIPAAKRTQADVDNYNKAVNEINALVTSTGKLMTADNETRRKLLESHDEAERKFLDKHIPK